MSLSPADFCNSAASGIPPRDVAKDLGVSLPTLYRWLPASKHS
ncbi:hypothetical protein FKD06_25180, partial [Serratia sp. SRS-8-S-2018]